MDGVAADALNFEIIQTFTTAEVSDSSVVSSVTSDDGSLFNCILSNIMVVLKSYANTDAGLDSLSFSTIKKVHRSSNILF